MITTGFALTILPQEAERLHSADSSLWLATYVMICGVTQLICPMAGLFSDRLNCSFGRRRPVMLTARFLCLYFCSRYLCPEGFLCALAFTETSLNVAFAAHAALPADLRVQPQFEEPSAHRMRCTRGAESEAGLISGIMALHSFLGAVCAVGFLDFTSGEILAAYSMDTERDADFFWVCYGRLLFYTSQSVIVFMAYFIRDMFQVRSEPEVISKLSLLVFIGQGVGAVVAVPSSRISDLVGCKPMVYVSCLVQCASFLAFIVAARVGWSVMLVGAVIYGLGAGSYMSSLAMKIV
ncbi:unnamed protein product [Durusdinium trenchii]|uniref:Uncharacterized protein n=1 Tax=Durusdinium trenchii TaxID=1381693 RepID=A0ABP0Q6T9_9DINO